MKIMQPAQCLAQSWDAARLNSGRNIFTAVGEAAF